MSLNSGKDSGQRPRSFGAWCGIASLVPGLLVVIVSLQVTGVALDGVRNAGKGGDPQGGMASGIALAFLGPVAAGIVLIGATLALIGLNQRPRHWGVIGLAMNLGFAAPAAALRILHGSTDPQGAPDDSARP